MKTVRKMILLILLLLIVTAGCSSNSFPPQEIIEGAVVRALDVKVYTRSFGAIKGGIEELGEVVSIVISNERTDQNGEKKVHAYDYEATVNFNDRAKRIWAIEEKQGHYSGTVKLVKRGDTWYRAD